MSAPAKSTLDTAQPAPQVDLVDSAGEVVRSLWQTATAAVANVDHSTAYLSDLFPHIASETTTRARELKGNVAALSNQATLFSKKLMQETARLAQRLADHPAQTVVLLAVHNGQTARHLLHDLTDELPAQAKGIWQWAAANPDAGDQAVTALIAGQLYLLKRESDTLAATLTADDHQISKTLAKRNGQLAERQLEVVASSVIGWQLRSLGTAGNLQKLAHGVKLEHRGTRLLGLLPNLSPWGMGPPGGAIAISGGGVMIMPATYNPVLAELLTRVDGAIVMLAKATDGALALAGGAMVAGGASASGSHLPARPQPRTAAPKPGTVKFTFIDPDNFTDNHVVAAILEYERLSNDIIKMEAITANQLKALFKLMFGNIEAEKWQKTYSGIRYRIMKKQNGPLAVLRAKRNGDTYVKPPWPKRPTQLDEKQLFKAIVKTEKRLGRPLRYWECKHEDQIALLEVIKKSHGVTYTIPAKAGETPTIIYARLKGIQERAAVGNATSAERALLKKLKRREAAALAAAATAG